MVKAREIAGERVIQAVVHEDDLCKLAVQAEVDEKLGTMEQSEVYQEVNDNIFVLVEASKLSLNDEFMKHVPQTKREKGFKELLTTAIQKGIKDFYRPRCDPSFSADGTGVTFKAGKKPAVGKSYSWWKEVAEKFMPERHSRLGTKSEYIAFLGILIKKLVEDYKWSVAEAWHAVCNDSKELGHYWNSKDAKRSFEDTCMREICGFFDIANTCKILAKDEDDFTGGFWLAGGFFDYNSSDNPLAFLEHYTILKCDYYHCVGWFVLSN